VWPQKLKKKHKISNIDHSQQVTFSKFLNRPWHPFTFPVQRRLADCPLDKFPAILILSVLKGMGARSHGQGKNDRYALLCTNKLTHVCWPNLTFYNDGWMDKQESLANAKGSARQPWYTGQKSLYTYSTITSSKQFIPCRYQRRKFWRCCREVKLLTTSDQHYTTNRYKDWSCLLSFKHHSTMVKESNWHTANSMRRDFAERSAEWINNCLRMNDRMNEWRWPSSIKSKWSDRSSALITL